MKIEGHHEGRRIVLAPGDYYATGASAVISTLLGSCIAACLYDPLNRIIGMNHFMLSNPRYSRDLPIHISEAGRYGIHAMELLVNKMVAKGTSRRQLRAKVFGGATIIRPETERGGFFCVGEVNCRFIRDYLENEGIPLDAQDLGGRLGRVIHFSNADFAVHRRFVGGNRSRKLAHRDQQCWQRALEQQLVEQPLIELW